MGWGEMREQGFGKVEEIPAPHPEAPWQEKRSWRGQGESVDLSPRQSLSASHLHTETPNCPLGCSHTTLFSTHPQPPNRHTHGNTPHGHPGTSLPPGTYNAATQLHSTITQGHTAQSPSYSKTHAHCPRDSQCSYTRDTTHPATWMRRHIEDRTHQNPCTHAQGRNHLAAQTRERIAGFPC